MCDAPHLPTIVYEVLAAIFFWNSMVGHRRGPHRILRAGTNHMGQKLPCNFPFSSYVVRILQHAVISAMQQYMLTDVCNTTSNLRSGKNAWLLKIKSTLIFNAGYSGAINLSKWFCPDAHKSKAGSVENQSLIFKKPCAFGPSTKFM